MVPDGHRLAEVSAAALLVLAAATYGVPVAGMFAHADEMLDLPSAGVFALRHPEHAFSAGVARLALALSNGETELRSG